MKLWFQVLFAHGYLWRRRFPDLFAADAHLRGERPSLWQIAFGLFWLAGGVLSAAYDLWPWAAIYLAMGIGFSFPLVGIVRVDRIFGDAAFWVTLSWATGVLALSGVFTLVIFCAITGKWLGALVFLGYLVLPAAPTTNGILSRYLFFAEPRSNADILERHPIDNAPKFLADTYWRLPREAARTMFHRPKAAA